MENDRLKGHSRFPATQIKKIWMHCMEAAKILILPTQLAIYKVVLPTVLRKLRSTHRMQLMGFNNIWEMVINKYHDWTPITIALESKSLRLWATPKQLQMSFKLERNLLALHTRGTWESIHARRQAQVNRIVKRLKWDEKRYKILILVLTKQLNNNSCPQTYLPEETVCMNLQDHWMTYKKITLIWGRQRTEIAKFQMNKVTVLLTIKTDKPTPTKIRLILRSTDKNFLKAQPARAVTIWIVTKADL